jgi:hypothetical protein
MLGRFETKLVSYQTIFYQDDSIIGRLLTTESDPSYINMGFFKPAIDDVNNLRHLVTPGGPIILPQLPTERPQMTYIGQSYSYFKT